MPSSGRKHFRSDRKSTRLNSSHTIISYADFCLKKIAFHQNSPREGAVLSLSLPSAAQRRARLVTDSRHHGHTTPLAAAQITRQDRFFFKDRATTETYLFPPPAPLPT